MVRTSITLNAALLERLKLFAQHREQTVSEVIEQVMAGVVHERAITHQQPRYEQVFRLKGAGKADPKLAALPVDELLYGKHAAWRNE